MLPTNQNSNGFIYGPTGSTTALPSDVVAVAYSVGGALITADDSGNVQGFPYDSPSFLEDVAISPFGEGAVISDDQFYFASTQSVQSLSQLNLGVQATGEVNLEFDALGRPHVLHSNGAAFTFDPITAAWSATQIGIFNDSNYPLALAADSTGTIGSAFVNNNDDLMYAYWTSTAGWNTTLVDINVDPFVQIGLDFDYADLPVLSYSKNGSLHVAYDPIVAVPEPGALAIAALSLGLARRHRA